VQLEERGKIFHSDVRLNGAEYGSDALRGQAHTLQEKLEGLFGFFRSIFLVKTTKKKASLSIGETL